MVTTTGSLQRACLPPPPPKKITLLRFGEKAKAVMGDGGGRSLEDMGRVRHSRVSSGTIWRVGELHLWGPGID